MSSQRQLVLGIFEGRVAQQIAVRTLKGTAPQIPPETLGGPKRLTLSACSTLALRGQTLAKLMRVDAIYEYLLNDRCYFYPTYGYSS